MADKIKIVLAVALLAAGIAGFYVWPDSLMIVRVGMVLAGAIFGVAVFWTSAPGKQFFAFAGSAVEETKRVVWPTRKETIQTTGLVFAFVVVMAVFLWLVDTGLMWIVRLLMDQQS
jgi:preprotein translocase subunit SecE